MLGWVKIHYNDRWWWPRPPHNIGLFCMMVLKVYCVTQKECVWVHRGWDIIIALLKLRLRSQSVFLFLSSWFLFCFSFINCHFFLVFWHIYISYFFTRIFRCYINTKLPTIFLNYFLRLHNIGNCYLMLDIKNFTHGSIYSKCSCFSFSTKYKISSICVKKNNSS